jgi:hypothetical protein
LEGWADANDGEMGFALMSDDEKRDVSLAAIKGRKQVAILDGEAELAYELSRQAEYQNSHGAVWVDVARVVNQDKHEGKDVRTPKAVKSMAYKYSTGGFS